MDKTIDLDDTKRENSKEKSKEKSKEEEKGKDDTMKKDASAYISKVFFTENDPSMRLTKRGGKFDESMYKLKNKHSKRTYLRML